MLVTECRPQGVVLDCVEGFLEVERCYPHFQIPFVRLLINGCEGEHVVCSAVSFSEASLVWGLRFVQNWYQAGVQQFQKYS